MYPEHSTAEAIEMLRALAHGPTEATHLVVGETGIGKTHLLDAVSGSVSVPTVVVRARPHESPIPLSGVSAAMAAVGQQLLVDFSSRFEIRHEDRTCFAQVQDAGPGKYFDPHYVFGDEDARPLNQRYGGSGTDVSPALNGCLGFTELNGTSDRVDWRFVERRDVPDGPWTRIETTRNDG